jgi:hypothetical protein
MTQSGLRGSGHFALQQTTRRLLDYLVCACSTQLGSKNGDELGGAPE